MIDSSDGPRDPVLPVVVEPPAALSGAVVRLELLSESHVERLAAAAADRDGAEYTVIPVGHAAADRFVQDAVADAAAQRRIAFAVVRVADGLLVGSTSFLSPMRWSGEPSHRLVSTVEVGSTWYSASVRGSLINPACKLLLLDHAFGVWSVRRVEFRVDARNTRSRGAMERLGAHCDGVLRSVQPGKGRDGAGGPRDTAVFSVLAEDWPMVRAGLVERLDTADDS